MNNNPIGIFDSGVGGLSVARAIRERLPYESLHYVADQQFNPYGERGKDSIAERAAEVVDFLLGQGCKAIVVACNTATVNAIETVRDRYDVPFIGVEPGVKPAAERTRSGCVGVLATRQTLASPAYQQLRQRVASQVTVVEQACPAFVRLVEQGNMSGSEVAHAVEEYLTPMLDAGADQVVLGCTHFSFLAGEIQRITAGRAELIDTAQSVADELARRLDALRGIHPNRSEVGEAVFWSSQPASPTPHSDLCTISQLWGDRVEVNRF